MSRTSTRLLAVLAAVTALSTGIAPALADAPSIKIPKLKEKVAELKIDVAGYVTTEKLKDTTSDCFPGITYHQVNSISFETGKPAALDVHSVSLPGKALPVITSNSTKNVGRADMSSRVFGLRTTNYCPPTEPDPEPLPPNCGKSQGKIKMSITPGEAPKEEDDLHPLKGVDMMLMIMRTGGGSDSPSCEGASAGQVRGPSGGESVLVSASFPGQAQIVPSGFDGPQLFNVKKKAQTRSAVFSGPCSKVTLKVYKGNGPAPSQGAVNADGDCYMHGKVVLKISRR